MRCSPGQSSGCRPIRQRSPGKFLWLSSERVRRPALPIQLPDPRDLMFIEVAVAAMADALVTRNLSHFPANQCRGVRVLTPRDRLDVWASAGM